MLLAYIILLLIGVPLVLFATHWRDASDRVAHCFDDLDFRPAASPDEGETPDG